MTNEEKINKLASAYTEGELALFLGAGVSMASGFPSWNQLVLAMYYSVVSDTTVKKNESAKGWRPFPNYLYAMAEWHLRSLGEPLDVTSRKIRNFYQDNEEKDFFDDFRSVLYGAFRVDDSGKFYLPDASEIKNKNKTLAEVATLCEGKVAEVISYNYDELLETVIDKDKRHCCSIVSSKQKVKDESLPIFHVHGFVPSQRAQDDEIQRSIVFTEDQYNGVANDPYSWSNIVQLQALSSKTVLMIGLSLTDKNIRRLLDAAQQGPREKNVFAILPKQQAPELKDSDIDQIDNMARSYLDNFSDSAIKAGFKSSRDSKRNEQIKEIFSALNKQDVFNAENAFEEIGVTPIFVDDISEIPAKLRKIHEGH